MTVTLYYNSSPNNAINKSITQTSEILCTHKAPVSLINPEIIVNTASFNMSSNSNYMYIDTFDRYYFINDFTLLDGGRILIRGTIDVLYTYRNNILASYVNVVRQENAHINETPDNLLPFAPDKLISAYRFEVQLDNADFNATTKCFMLTVAGGGTGS